MLFFGSKKVMCVKWGQAKLQYFKISNGARQDAMSPRLFAVYVYDLSKQLIDASSGCCIKHQCINHAMYAEDVCLISPCAPRL